MTSTRNTISSVIFHDDICAQVEFKEDAEFWQPGLQQNVVVAAWTTSLARIHLYTALDNLKRRVLYMGRPNHFVFHVGRFPFDLIRITSPLPPLILLYLLLLFVDTDSVIYTHRPGQWEPPLGELLGQYKDELDGDTIVELIAPGPKNYGYRTAGGQTVLKVRGLSLKPMTHQVINLDVVREIVLRPDDNETVDVPMGVTFIRDKSTWRLRTHPYRKQYKMVYSKRLMLSNFQTLPWGFK